MKTAPSPLHVSSANGVYLHLASGEQLIDAISSWWCVIHGYRHPVLDQAVRDQLNQVAHVMLGGLVHSSTEQLAETIVSICPTGLSHCFFSDSGSVGVEVALKIAYQYYQNRGQSEKSNFVAYRGSYHGDTTGCMGVSDPTDGMHVAYGKLVRHAHFLPPIDHGFFPDNCQLQADIAILESFLDAHAQTTAAIIIEPILQAAGGFRIHSPAYLQALRRLTEAADVLLICDEVATGIGRTGQWFAVNHADICPDIMVLGKGLTGGYLGLAATVTTTPVFDQFYGDDDGTALMHGPTFMGNPLACAVAKASLELMVSENRLAAISRISSQFHRNFDEWTHPAVREIRILGAMLAIECCGPVDFHHAQSVAIQNGVWLRPIDNVIYSMPPYIIPPDELDIICDAIKTIVRSIPTPV